MHIYLVMRDGLHEYLADCGNLPVLMARGANTFQPQESGFSSFFFCHAALITHGESTDLDLVLLS